MQHWANIDGFLNAVAKSLKYDRDLLSFTAELRRKGPTVGPGASSDADPPVTASASVTLPYGGYDSLGSNHIEYRVVLKEGEGKVKIPRTLYTFQLHPFDGCCRFSINRWVRIEDSKKWPKALQKQALRFRMKLSNQYGYKALFVSKGPSFTSAELYSEFEAIFNTGRQKLYGIETSKVIK